MATQTKKTKISSQAVMGEIKTLAMLTGGVVIGSLGGKMIDKVLNVDATATGFNAKALARPIVLLGVGTAGNLMLKDPNMKMLATGVGASGLLSGVKVFLKKDLSSSAPQIHVILIVVGEHGQSIACADDTRLF